MEQHKECLICKSSNLSEKIGYEKYFLVECASCRFVFTKKIPTDQELEEHYEGYGRNDYLSPITIKRYNELLDYFEKFRKNNKILDVGCGIGYFLEEAKKRGWTVYGTEYTQEACAICISKNISMQKGELEENNYPLNSFDVITSFEVIEHINNPILELSKFYNLLRKGGLVYITTPNFNSLLRYRLKAEYNVICYPEHLSYYTPRTIRLLMKKTGFKTQKILTTGISLTRLKTSKTKVKEGYIAKNSSDEKIRNSMEKNRFLQLFKWTLNSLLTFFGKGDALKGYFIKP